MLRASAQGVLREGARIAPLTATVEVRCGVTVLDEEDVHAEAVADAEHVAQQAPVAVDAIRRRLHRQSYKRPWRQELLRLSRPLVTPALDAEVARGRVDLDEADLRATRQVDGVAVDDARDSVDVRRRRRA